MSNMSYCRFQNTSRDFDDCADILQKMMDGESETLPEEEIDAAKRLIKRAQETIAALAEYLGSESDVLVDDDLDQVFEQLQAEVEEGGGEED